MKFYLSICCLFIFISASAQLRLADSRKDINIRAGSMFYMVGGEPVLTSEFSSVVEGTPYFSDDWMQGMIVLYNNAVYKDLLVRINLAKGGVHYQDQFGKEFIVESAIKEVVLTDSVNDRNFRFIHAPLITNSKDKRTQQWFLWLLTGNASLYKVFNKDVIEQKPYGSASIEQRVRTSEKYAVQVNGSVFYAKKLKDLPSILSNKREEVEKFIRSGKMPSAITPDDQFAAVIEYYNSLMR